jgi:hypothetical protein
MSALARRLERLEAQYLGSAVLTPEALASMTHMAIADGLEPDELITEARAVMETIGPPLTMERVTRYYAAETGCTVAELMADAARLAERYP